MCGKAAESLPHVQSGCSALAQSEFINLHNAALKVLFCEMCKDLRVVDSIPLWYSPVTAKPMYESHSTHGLPGCTGLRSVIVIVSRLTEWIRGLRIMKERKSGQ